MLSASFRDSGTTGSPVARAARERGRKVSEIFADISGNGYLRSLARLSRSPGHDGSHETTACCCSSSTGHQLGCAHVVAWLLERRLRSLEARLARARDELAVLDEQEHVFAEMAEEARVRSLVEESPVASHELAGAQRHADAVAKSRDVIRDQVSQLEQAREEMLERALRRDLDSSQS